MIIYEWGCILATLLKHPPCDLLLQPFIIVDWSPDEIALINYGFVDGCIVGLILGWAAFVLLVRECRLISTRSVLIHLVLELLFHKLLVVEAFPASSLPEGSDHQLWVVAIVTTEGELALVPVCCPYAFENIIWIAGIISTWLNGCWQFVSDVRFGLYHPCSGFFTDLHRSIGHLAIPIHLSWCNGLLMLWRSLIPWLRLPLASCCFCLCDIPIFFFFPLVCQLLLSLLLYEILPHLWGVELHLLLVLQAITILSVEDIDQFFLQPWALRQVLKYRTLIVNIQIVIIAANQLRTWLLLSHFVQVVIVNLSFIFFWRWRGWTRWISKVEGQDILNIVVVGGGLSSLYFLFSAFLLVAWWVSCLRICIIVHIVCLDESGRM